MRILVIFMLVLLSSKLLAESSLRFNILDSYPFGYTNAAGLQVGTYWEYVGELDKRTDLKIEREIVPKARVIEYLKRGIADAAILFKSPKIAEHVIFVSKIREIPIVVAHRKDTPIDRYEDLHKAQYVGHFRSGSVSIRFDNDEKINKVPIYTYPSMIEMLQKGRVEAIVGNGIVIQNLLKKQCLGKDIKLSPMTLGNKEQWLVMSKKSKHLDATHQLREAIDSLRSDGLLDDIFDRHLTEISDQCL